MLRTLIFMLCCDVPLAKARFCGLVRWLVLGLLNRRGLSERNRRALHRCLHTISSQVVLKVPVQVAQYLASGELYALYTSELLGVDSSSTDTGAELPLEVHNRVVTHLHRVGRLAQLGSDPARTAAILAESVQFSRDEHAMVMTALVRTADDKLFGGLVDDVAREVSQFAAYSAAGEHPRDTEGAVSLWLRKVSQQVSTVLQQKHSSAATIAVSHDPLDACGDGRILTAVLAYYRPDLISLDTLNVDSTEAADEAAIPTIKAALHAASRASCPCPLTTTDLAERSPLLKPLLLSWLKRSFAKLSELPISTRLPVEIPDKPETPPARVASRATGSRPTSALSISGAQSQRPVSRKGSRHDFQSTTGSQSQRPVSRRSSNHNMGTSGGVDGLKYTAETLELSKQAHVTRPHQTVRSASRPPSTRSTIPYVQPRQPVKSVVGPAQVEPEQEVIAWRNRDHEVEDKVVLREIESFEKLHGAFATTSQPKRMFGTPVRQQQHGPPSPAMSSTACSDDLNSESAAAFFTERESPVQNASLSPAATITTVLHSQVQPTSSVYPPVDLDLRLSSEQVNDVISAEVQSRAVAPRKHSNLAPPPPTSLPTMSPKRHILERTRESPVTNSPSKAPPRSVSNGMSPSHSMEMTAPGSIFMTDRRYSTSPGPETRRLGEQLSAKLVQQLRALPLCDEDPAEDEQTVTSRPASANHRAKIGHGHMNSSRPASTNGKHPSETPVQIQTKQNRLGVPTNQLPEYANDSQSSEMESSAVDLSEETNTAYDLQGVPGQVRDVLLKSEAETFEELRATLLVSTGANTSASYTIDTPAIIHDGSKLIRSPTRLSISEQDMVTLASSDHYESENEAKNYLENMEGTHISEMGSVDHLSPELIPEPLKPDHVSPNEVMVAEEYSQQTDTRIGSEVDYDSDHQQSVTEYPLFPKLSHISESMQTAWDKIVSLNESTSREFGESRAAIAEATLRTLSKGTSSATKSQEHIVADSSNEVPLATVESEAPPILPQTISEPTKSQVIVKKQATSFEVKLDSDDGWGKDEARQRVLEARQRRRLEHQQRLAKSRPVPGPGTTGAMVKSAGKITLEAASGDTLMTTLPGKAVPTSLETQTHAKSRSVLAAANGYALQNGANPSKATAKDKKRSNRQLVRNAVANTCLAGKVNEVALETVVSKLESSLAMHFIILLHDPNDLKFRALYEYDLDTQQGRKLSGRGPAKIGAAAVQHAFRYNSGTRRFTPARTPEVTNLVDAVCLVPTRTKKALPSVI